MGRDKATLMLEGHPLWQRQLGLLRELSPAEMFIAGHHAPEWLPVDLRFIADPPDGQGPLGGVTAALGAMSATHLLALAIDMPAMSAGHLATLWSAASPGCGVAPWVGDHPEPLPAVYPAEAFSLASERLAGAEFSLNAFTEVLLSGGRMKRHAVADLEATLYANCNTPADWERHATARENLYD